jgi:hypothetical protein
MTLNPGVRQLRSFTSGPADGLLDEGACVLGLNSGNTSFGSTLTLCPLDWFMMAMSWSNVTNGDDPTSDVGVELFELELWACKESSPGLFIVVSQSR